MRLLDRALQRWRIDKARAHIPDGSSVLDVGCADGELFRRMGDALGQGVGIDPNVQNDTRVPQNVELVRGLFPSGLRDRGPFDVVAMLAVLEHVPVTDHAHWNKACADLVRSGGRLIITTPAPAVDGILDVLMRLRLLDGMEAEQHYGFQASGTPAIFAPSFRCVWVEAFQLGLNYLFVFERA